MMQCFQIGESKIHSILSCILDDHLKETQYYSFAGRSGEI